MSTQSGVAAGPEPGDRAMLDVPPGGMALSGHPAGSYTASKRAVAVKRVAMLLRLNQKIVHDIEDFAREGKPLRFHTGRAPRLQYGSKSIDLSVGLERFTHELYTSHKHDVLSYTATITHQASSNLHAPNPPLETAGTDNALAQLKSSLAGWQKEKEANQATVVSGVLSSKTAKVPSRGYPSKPFSQSGSPALGSTHAEPAPTSAPAADSAAAAQKKAMTHAMSHLLACKPKREWDVFEMTCIPPGVGRETLKRIADLDQGTGLWTLRDKVYKDLDIWKFKYPTRDHRNHAIDCAVRAFDRLRLSKDDKLWQLLLPENERGKGKCLSRLHGAALLPAANDSRSPMRAASPAHAQSDTEGRANGRVTPKLTSTPMARTASASSKTMSIEKRLKESQKRSVLEAKRKEKEAKSDAKSDKPSTGIPTAPRTVKRSDAPAPKKTNSKFKSAEVVHSSDDESEGARSARTKPQAPPKPGDRAKPSDARSPRGTSSSEGNRPLASTRDVDRGSLARPKPDATAPQAARREPASKTAKVRDGATPTASVASAKTSGDPRRETPSQRVEKRPVAAIADGKSQKPMPSPRKPDTKLKNPSPLGRSSGTPSLFGNFERSPPIVKKITSVPAKPAASAALSGGTPVEAGKKRPAPDDVAGPKKSLKTDATVTPGKVTEPAKKPLPSQAKSINAGGSLKRKADDISSNARDQDAVHPSKHRRTESSSTQSMTFSSSSSGNSHTTTARTSVASPSPPNNNQAWMRSPSNASSSMSQDPLRLSWERALDEAERFRNELYPAYVRLHKKISGAKPGEVSRAEQRRLFEMHERLSALKREIALAAEAA